VDELKKEIKTFIESQRFQADSIPYNLEFWKYEDRFYISRNPKVVATQDLETYKTKVCKKDSLSGFYIPIDIMDAHKELDKMLADSAKLKLKNGESSHYGLGRQLRNYWGLWSGGRLKCYFAEMELYHPDNISSFILSTYRMKLNNQQKNLDSLIQAYSKSEKERMKIKN